MKGSCSFRFNRDREELIPYWWRSYRESTFANMECLEQKAFGNRCSKRINQDPGYIREMQQIN